MKGVKSPPESYFDKRYLKIMEKQKDWNKLIEERYGKTFDTEIGAKFTIYKDGKCEAELKVEEKHLNMGRSVHGGVINALCDIALSGAVNSTLIDGPSVVTLQMGVSFLRPGLPGDTLTAFAEIVKKGRTIVYVEGGIKNQNGKLLARASGDWFVKN